MKIKSQILVILSFFLASTSLVFAQDGKKLFRSSCAACHSIGKGKLVGPDLEGVTYKREEAWLLSFIKSSQTLINSGDADAQAIYAEFNEMMMPDQNFSDDEIKVILAYIKSESPEPSATADAEEEEVVEAEPEEVRIPTEAEIQNGLQLFSGETRLENKGPSCLSCHHVGFDGIDGGGNLAKDLTAVHERMGTAGISGILTAPPFPAMTVAYKDNPLTDEEIFQLTAFLGHVSDQKIYQHSREYGSRLLIGGGVGVLCIIVAISLLWFKRKKESVKKSIFDRQKQIH